ncbi:MAG: twin-arginine translocase subunit TatC, partial [Halobacteriaceae archaeon]
RRRGVLQDVPVSRWKAIAVALMLVVLFVGGLSYAYSLFFPLMFDFLATNATRAGLTPMYSIVHWTQFILVLGLSFGLAAQLPLAMTALSYSGIIPYETFRDKWKYAIVLIFTFGAVFSPPDPFTQLLWATPLVALYAFSLYLSKLVVTLKRARGRLNITSAVKSRWNIIAGTGVVGGAIGYAISNYGGIEMANDALRSIGSDYRIAFISPLFLAVVGGALAILLAAAYIIYKESERAARAGPTPGVPAGSTSVDHTGEPGAINLSELDAAGVKAAPPEAFASLSEEDAVSLAREAMVNDDDEKARAILDRFDEAAELREREQEQQQASESVESESPISRTVAGMADAFTEEETTEDDIGGYYYDLRFVIASLRSRAFRVVMVFLLVLGGTFVWLYTGGIGTVREDFVSRLPEAVVGTTELTIITLHPVEALMFEVKISTLLAAISTLPVICYYAWPALRERGLARGDRRTFLIWGGSLFIGIALGSAIGYLYIAPGVISWLVYDAHAANMVIAYRVSSFFWLVFFTTVGVGLLADIPVSMLLFHWGGIVSYPSMRRAWRGVALAIFVLASVVTSKGVLSMIFLGLPVIGAYWMGLGLLHLITLGGRR